MWPPLGQVMINFALAGSAVIVARRLASLVGSWRPVGSDAAGLDGDDVDAVIQVGTNLAMARVAGIAEFWLGKPVIAINTATYWWALRQNGINDRIPGYGALLMEH